MKFPYRTCILAGLLPVGMVSAALWSLSGTHISFGWRFIAFYCGIFFVVLWAGVAGVHYGFATRHKKPTGASTSVRSAEVREFRF